MIAGKEDIPEYIPQRPPMVMISSLLHSDDQTTITGLHIEPANLFAGRGVLSESGLVENIAQTAAAGVGFSCKKENKKVPVGFIASIRDLVVHALPAVGTDIVTETVVTNQVMDVSIVKGVVRQGEAVLAECEMRIFIKPETPESNG
jgi:predicted hotdog family 3-hydroxylacyl-ACP dehydratase